MNYNSIPTGHIQFASKIGVGTSSGTGFLFEHHGSVYLVSARHCVYGNSSSSPLGDTIKCSTYRTNDGLVIGLHSFSIHLPDVPSENILSHGNNDIIGIKVADLASSRTGRNMIFVAEYCVEDADNRIGGLNVAKFGRGARSLEDICIGSDCVVVGYPVSIGMTPTPQLDFSKPLLRKGIIAGENKSLGTIIIDCPVYPGNSGGPILEVHQCGNHCNKLHYSVIGVVSERVSFAATTTVHGAAIGVTRENSGYGVVVPIQRLWS